MKKLCSIIILLAFMGCAAMTPLQQTMYDTGIIVMTGELLHNNPEIAERVIDVTEGMIAALKEDISVVLLQALVSAGIADSELAPTTKMVLNNFVQNISNIILTQVKRGELNDRETKRFIYKTITLINQVTVNVQNER